MSSTIAETAGAPTYGIFKFIDPDLSISADGRGFFALPASKEVKFESLQLLDYRTDPNIVKGAAGLDAQGFTMVNHQSALTGDQWFAESDVENIYFPEVEELVRKLTGAKTFLINNAAFRRKQAKRQEDPKFYTKRGEESFNVGTMRSAKPIVAGKKVESSIEPARGIHCDYSFKGLQNVVRYGRPDIIEAAKEILEAEDMASKTGGLYSGPRFAAFSVWRPVKTVRKDPLAVSVSASILREDFVPFDYRVPNLDDEYLVEAYSIKPPKDASLQRWYWLPEQKPDEVLVIRLADSEAQKGMVAANSAHGSPVIPGTEHEEARESIEVRILAFW